MLMCYLINYQNLIVLDTIFNGVMDNKFFFVYICLDAIRYVDDAKITFIYSQADVDDGAEYISTVKPR